METLRRLRTQWDRLSGAGAILIGAVFLLVGYYRISDTAYAAEQLPYILSGGVGGIFFVGVGASLWLSADLRDEWHKLDRIEQVLADGFANLELGLNEDGSPTIRPHVASNGAANGTPADESPDRTQVVEGARRGRPLRTGS